MAEQDVLPPDRGAHELGPVDFGLFEESWRQTFAFSPGASSEGRSCRWLNATSPDQENPSPLQRDAYRTIYIVPIYIIYAGKRFLGRPS